MALVLGLGLVAADVLLDEPIRRTMERNVNGRLQGYTARIPAVDFHVLGLSVDVEGLVLRQDAHPVPPVLHLPLLEASVEWKALLRGRLVGDMELHGPELHVNLLQLREESRDRVSIDERGWQDALEAIYPLKIDELRIHRGTLVYSDDSGFRPLRAQDIDALARNIRNIRSPERQYPSSVHVTGRLFDVGSFAADGHADFLAKPHAGAAGRIEVRQAELDYFQPLVEEYGFEIRKGLLGAAGRFEYAPSVKTADLERVDVDGAVVDYIYGTPADARMRKVGRQVASTARQVMNEPRFLVRIRQLELREAEIGIVNRQASPHYRAFLGNASLGLENLSSRADDGAARARLRSDFMGSGRVEAEGAFFPEGKRPNFKMKVRVDGTHLPSMNPLLRAHGGLDVVGGHFSLYSVVAVKNGRIEGYVKPLFHEADVYDPRQDQEKTFFRKAYEAIAEGLSRLLENRPREEVATIATLSGPVENPDASTIEIIVNLARNAFIEAILPGWEREVERARGRDGGRRDAALDAARDRPPTRSGRTG